MLVTTITKIPTPTDRAAAISRMYRFSKTISIKNGDCNNRAIIVPIKAANKCPPITLRGVAATLLGTTNIVKAEEAIPTTIAVFKVSPMRSKRIKKAEARQHCKK